MELTSRCLDRLAQGGQLLLHLDQARGRGVLGGVELPTELAQLVGDDDAELGQPELEPGKYTVILEPAAAAGLLEWMMEAFDAREADEGRSFLAKKGGGNRLGEKLFDERVSIHAGPADVAPMVLVGRRHWTTLPVWPLLQRLSQDRAMAAHVHLVDDVDDVPALLEDR